MTTEVEVPQKHPPAARRYVIRMDGKAVELHDPMPTGGQILKAANKLPPHQYVLIQLLERSSRSIGLDEVVEVKGDGIELFRSFVGDRIFRLLVDSNDYDWGAEAISESDLREIAAIPEEFAIELVQDDTSRVLERGEVVSLDGKGVERFRRVMHLVKVYLGEVEHRIPAGVYTTEQLIQILGVKPGYLLNVLDEDGNLVTLVPNQKVRVVDCLRFVEQVPCGGAS